ncbi:hypothetical protein LTR84_007495 [Exophiala bonariae]|uniref:Diacetyl reductase [(S)-acetoin forming] n=1 Tax=Exophiala bonariae TaxID=1690606 RepID=A0AAV9N1G2_9EURO|nr:hypothetical protein LTR84_007495 [Exophiala bonariae]
MPVAIVTGASRGLGRAIALRLADDGLDVAVNDIPPQSGDLDKVKVEIEQKGRRSVCVIADVTNEEEVKNMVATTVETLGELTVLVANAGIVIPKPLIETELSEFRKVVDINITGVFLCYREAAKQMIAQGKGGRIIGASSLAGFRPSPGAISYPTSKWAVRGLTQSSAMELAPYDINVNAYCPGPVDTPMWEVLDEAIGKKQGLAKGVAFEKSVEARSAFKRASTPEDVAALVSFLAGPDSRNITGQSLLVDGGKNSSGLCCTPSL